VRIGWYIHHHGRGHLHRFLSVRPRLADVTVLSSLPRPSGLDGTEWIELPMDVPVAASAARSADAGGVLHWAPLATAGYTERMAVVAAWIAATRPDAVVIDVSVEMALLARLMGVAPIWVAQRGIREDLPHQLAYAAAQTIIAPWTEATQRLGAPGAPPRERTTLVGALSRFDDLPAPAAATQASVCVLLGFGGHEIAAADIAAAARATPNWRWDVTGVSATASAPNVCVHPPDCDVWALLARATVAVSTASSNAVGEVAAARRPLICLPQPRPFDEQRDQAEALRRAGLATVLERWPAGERWPALLEASARRDPGEWRLLHDGDGAKRFARAIEATACA
jgi:predicted glycosyltransferase